jgi:hypothetical protein
MNRLTAEIAYDRRCQVARQQLAHAQGGLRYARKYIDDADTLRFWEAEVGKALDMLWDVQQSAPVHGEIMKRAA